MCCVFVLLYVWCVSCGDTWICVVAWLMRFDVCPKRCNAKQHVYRLVSRSPVVLNGVLLHRLLESAPCPLCVALLL